MNAHELAIQLKAESSQAEYGYVVDDWKLLDDAANMLRQQAEKISNMEIWEKKYLDHIAELERQLKTKEAFFGAEPYLSDWSKRVEQQQSKSFEAMFNYNRGFNDCLAKMIDAQQLSDEEIYEIWEQFNGEIKNFARAIEERHGIK